MTGPDPFKVVSSPLPQEPTNVADRLERTLPPARLRLLHLAARSALDRHMSLYLVGGFVRDLLLHRPGVDFDLVVEGDAIRLAVDLAAEFGGRVVSHPRFGTAKWRLDPGNQALWRALGAIEIDPRELPPGLDLITARTEIYPQPTSLPTVSHGRIELDLQRRDFTINTLAVRLGGPHHGDLLDPWGGGSDLREGWIRVLHADSFVEDPTRMLRAARLEQRLSFRIEPNTLELLNHALPLLDRVSGERVRNELEVALAEPHPAPIFRRMADLRLLAAIHPGLEWDGWLESGFERAADFDPPKTWQLRVSPTILDLRYGSWMVRRSEAESAAVGERLRLSRPRSRLLTESSRVFHELPEWVRRGDRPSRITSMLEPVADTSLVVAWLALEGNPDAQASLDAYFSRWRKIRPGVTGETLRRMGISPGPVYRRILGEIREAWLDGEIHSEADEAARLRDLVARESSDG